MSGERVKDQDLGYSKILAALKKLPSGPQAVYVGFPASTDSDIIERAVFNELGTDTGTPERSFLRSTADEKQGEWGEMVEEGLTKVLEGRGGSTSSVLKKVGAKAAGDVQDKITALQEPPNAESTIAQKGSSNPLINTGDMRRAVTYEVRDE